MMNTLETKTRALQILIVEDHPLTCMGYALILEQAILNGKIPQSKIQQVHSLRKAYQLLIAEGISFDMVFLDICMKPYPEENLFSGEDLGRLIFKKCPETKILVMTSLTDKYRLEGILNKIKPYSFLIKSEVNDFHLIKAIQHLLKSEYYYSQTILTLMRNEFYMNHQIDEEEKKFLYLLSKGIRNKEISEYLPWSLSKIEKRKRILHKKLGEEKGNTLALVNKAKDLGII